MDKYEDAGYKLAKELGEGSDLYADQMKAIAAALREAAAEAYEDAGRLFTKPDACNPPNFIPNEIRQQMADKADALRSVGVKNV